MKSVREITDLKEDALEKKLEELRKELMRFKSQVASGTIPKNPGKIKVIRRTIARIHTVRAGRKKKKE